MQKGQSKVTPKVFISYSWTSPGHQARVKQWAEQLLADGVDVVLDIYDLKEGHDKFSFMERMVTDPSVTHVLIISDQSYSEKADARKAGVGTESQIISKEVYEKIDQSKFIPVACEFNSAGNPFLPTFLSSRIWIDFSTPEAANANWEQLIRVFYGKPLHEKPALGNVPVYIRENSATPSSPVISKFNALKQALLLGRPALDTYRQDFLDACVEFADALRIRQRPDVDSLGEKILTDCGKLKQARNHIIDWVLLEATNPSDRFAESLLSLLERLLELKSRPPELTSWNEAWFEAHSLFGYETFLYIIGALMKASALTVLHDMFTSHYLLPETSRRGGEPFATFGELYADSRFLQSLLAPEGSKLVSPAAELIKRQADRTDLSFHSIIEAELLVLLMAFITPGTYWYPQTLHYAYGIDFPFFLRATQHKHFKKLAVITGIDDADTLRAAVKAGREKIWQNNWSPFGFRGTDFWSSMNMDKLDTLK